MKIVKDIEKAMGKDNHIEEYFSLPLNDVLLGLKLVQKSKGKKLKVPYVKIEFAVPPQVATTIPEFLTTNWKLMLLGARLKTVKKK